MTVLGPVDGSELGVTLPHEHLIVDLTPQVPFSGLLNEPALTVAELAAFTSAGGRTVVDCGSDPIGRDPQALQRISEAAGIHVIMGCGWYREPFLDRDLIDRLSTAALAEALVREITDGVADTGIRPGIIGEIGSERFITSAEERAIRAAGIAAAQTGLTVSTHTARWPNGLRQLGLLQECGVDSRRVVIGHSDTVPDPEYHAAIARTGAYVQFDTIRGDHEFEVARRVQYVLAMRDLGLLQHVLLSHDVCLREHLAVRGGSGYGYVHAEFAERLRDAGLTSDDWHLLTVENPRRALSGA